MRPEIMRSHRETIQEWASLYDRDGAEGMREIGFLLARAERQIGRILKDPSVAAEPVASEPEVVEPAEG